MTGPDDRRSIELRVVHVDLSRCVGHGKCYAIAPELMQPFDDEGHAEFYGEPISASDAKRVARGHMAIESCPEEALSWRPAATADPSAAQPDT